MPESDRSVRWGVLSTARINEAVLRGVGGSPAVDVVAVGSRSAESAEAFAPELEWTLAALEAGKHVLCEKPLSPRASEVERCFDTAERQRIEMLFESARS